MGLQHTGCLLTGRPPQKASFRQTFLTEPKSLSIVDQNTNGCASPAPEQKHATGKRILMKPLFTEPRQRVDTLPAVHGIDCDQDLHLWRDLNHRGSLQNFWAHAASSFISMF